MELATLLEVAVGLAFTYLLLSVLCSGLNEWIAHTTGRRGRFLREGLLNILADRWFSLRLVNHPSVAAHRRGVGGKAQQPSYLPSETFVQALFDVLVAKAEHLGGPSSNALEESNSPELDRLKRAAALCRDNGFSIGAAVLPCLKQANGDLAAASKVVAAWYDSSMDRVTGWYKRGARTSLFVIAAAVAVVLNADSIEITRALMSSDPLRKAVVEEAFQAASSGKVGGIQVLEDGVVVTLAPEDGKALVDVGTRLEAKGLPIGFSCLAPAFDARDGKYATIRELATDCFEAGANTSSGQWTLKISGWLITALALSLSAPFWFDLLNRLVDLRGEGGKPRPAQGSKGKAEGSASA